MTQPLHSLLHPWEMKIHVHANVHTQMFTATLFIITEHWKQLKHPLTGEWINQLWYIHCNGTVLEQWKGTNHKYLQQHEESGKCAERKEARHKSVCSCIIPRICKWRKKHFNVQRQKTHQWLPRTKAGNGNWMSRGIRNWGRKWWKSPLPLIVVIVTSVCTFVKKWIYFLLKVN